MFSHTKSFAKSVAKIKFGKLGMAGMMLFAGLGIATVVGSLPGVSPKAHAENWQFISTARLWQYPDTVYADAYGCKTLRNTIYGQVADVKILYTVTSPLVTPLAQLRASRNGNDQPVIVSYQESRAWWAQSHIFTTTVSVPLGDWLDGYVGGRTMFEYKSPTSLGNC